MQVEKLGQSPLACGCRSIAGGASAMVGDPSLAEMLATLPAMADHPLAMRQWPQVESLDFVFFFFCFCVFYIVLALFLFLVCLFMGIFLNFLT